jgi:hypothetical protein
MSGMLTRLGQWIVNRIILSILEYAGKYVPHIIQEWKRKKEREIAQAEAKKVYEEKQADPSLSMEEKMKAHADYMNAGRKQ